MTNQTNQKQKLPLKYKSTHREYRIWKRMIETCTNKLNGSYHLYGGAGATVTSDWMTYANFLRDMGPIGDEYTRVMRRDPKLPYCKENCLYGRGYVGGRMGKKRPNAVKKTSAYQNPIRVCVTIEQKLLDKITEKSLHLSLSEHRKISATSLIRECLIECFPLPQQLDMFQKS